MVAGTRFWRTIPVRQPPRISSRGRFLCRRLAFWAIASVFRMGRAEKVRTCLRQSRSVTEGQILK